MPHRRVVKYEAAAGSGKTYQLTFEYLKCIFQLFHNQSREEKLEQLIGSILAVTFTNKAANEMKERILDKLRKLSLSHRGFLLSSVDLEIKRNLSRQTGIQEEKIPLLASDIIDSIISHYTDFNVKTIDSLMSSIIKVISPDLNLPPDFEIGLDAGEMLRGKARQFIENISQTNWTFLEQVLMNIKNTETLYNWNLDEMIVDHIVEFYEMGLHQGNGGVSEICGLEEQVFNAYSAFKKHLAEWFSCILEEPGNNRVHKGVNRKLVNDSLISEVRDFLESERNIKKIDSIISRKMFSTEDCSALLKKDAGTEFRQRICDRFQRMKNRLSDFIFWLSLNRIGHFSSFFADFVEFWDSERVMIFVNEFSRTIREKLLEWERSALPYLYLKLSDRFRYFLFDEFQDTSELQFKALLPILEEVMVSDERSSLFIVGDRKQAIYRWRGGNAELMNESRLREELHILEMITPEAFTVALDKNWRSGKKIIAFNNSFWNPENLECMLKKIGAAEPLIDKVKLNFSHAQQESPGTEKERDGFVCVSQYHLDHSDGDKDFHQKRILYDKCLEIITILSKEGYRGSDIAILTRSNDDGRDLVSFLSERQILTLSDESLFLFSSPAINEIICFFRFIDYPPDNLSFYTFICGEIFQTMAKKNNPLEMADFDESFFAGIPGSTPFYKQYKKYFPKSWESLIDPFLKQAGFSPPYDIFQDITLVFQLYENFSHSAAFFLSFGSILHELEQREINSISSFLDEWDRNTKSKNPYSIKISEEKSRIRVMTIHKAKGLEFPAVIVPFLSRPAMGDRNLFWKDGSFYHITKAYARLNSDLKEMYLREIGKSFIDELNLLYVALTRAKDVLFIPFVCKPTSLIYEPDGFKRFKDFSEIVSHHPILKDGLLSGVEHSQTSSWEEYTLGELTSRARILEEQDREMQILPVHSKYIPTSAWEKEFLVFSSVDFLSGEQKRTVERGEAIHRILSQIDRFQYKDQIRTILSPLLEKENLEDDGHRLENFLSDDRVFPLFQGEMEVFTEKEVAGFVGDRVEYRRIDRLLFKNENILVVDFKTGQEKRDEHRQQISEYMEILAPLFPGKNMRGYLLYLDLGVVEEIQC